MFITDTKHTILETPSRTLAHPDLFTHNCYHNWVWYFFLVDHRQFISYLLLLVISLSDTSRKPSLVVKVSAKVAVNNATGSESGSKKCGWHGPYGARLKDLNASLSHAVLGIFRILYELLCNAC